MESFFHFICLFYALQYAFWPVKGAYYVKPTGRYEITEIPLPSSIIEQIDKNNKYTPIQGPVTPTGVLIQTPTTVHIPPPKPAPCPPPSVCPCPCPQYSSLGNPASYLRPLPKSGNNTQNCPSMCVCICIDAVLSQVKSPAPFQPKPKAAGPQVPVPNSFQSGSVQSFSSLTSSHQLVVPAVSSSPSAAKATPTITTSSPSTVSSFVQQSVNSITCPGITGCASSGNPVMSVAKTSPSAVTATNSSTKQSSPSEAIPVKTPGPNAGAMTSASLSSEQVASSVAAVPPTFLIH